nr:UPF0179 family protein [Candidatus Sigynarchaeota archaeon]
MSYNRKKQEETKKADYIVTLALENKSEVGKEFYHEEIPAACNDCPLFQICMKNLIRGRHYTIIEVNDSVRHACPKNLFPGEMIVVKVREKPLIVSFPAGKTFEGMKLTFNGQGCPETKCKYHDNCDPSQEVLDKGTPVKCVKILKKIRLECKLNRDLSLMQVSRER